MGARSRGFLASDEVVRGKVGAYWTRTGGMPVSRVTFLVTDRRLLLIQPVVSTYYLLILPFILPFGLLMAGWIGVAAVMASMILMTAFGPRRLRGAQTLSDVVTHRVVRPSGALRWLAREVVELAFRHGEVWRLSADGRNVLSAASIEAVLAQTSTPTAKSGFADC